MIFTARLHRLGFDVFRHFGDIDDYLWAFGMLKAHLQPPIEIMTHPDLNVEGVVIDGTDRETLADRLLRLRPYLPASIDRTGKITCM